MSVSPITLDSTYLPPPANDTNPQDDRVLNLALSALSLKGKKVSFSEMPEIVLIPTRQEYSEDGLSREMWRTNEEISKFKISATNEQVQFFRANYSKTDLTEIILRELPRKLYQSDPTVIIANTLTNTIVSELSRSSISGQLKRNRARKEDLKAHSYRLRENLEKNLKPTRF